MANLINLAQIKGGLKLKETLDAIEKSYPASKVTTTNKKLVYKKAEDGETADSEGFLLDKDGKRVVDETSELTYTAQELLTELKTAMDSLTGGVDGSGSIQEQIKKSVKTITDRKVNDYTRVWIGGYNSLDDIEFFKLDNTWSQKMTLGQNPDLPTDLSGLKLTQDDLKKFVLDVPYVVYLQNNTIVLDEFENNVYVTFTKDATTEEIKAELSAVPCSYRRVKEQKEVVDEAVTIENDKHTLILANKYIDVTTLVVKNAEGTVIDSSTYYVKAIGGKIEFRKEQKETEFTVSYKYTNYKDEETKFPTYPLTYIEPKKDGEKGIWSGAWFKIYPVQQTTFGDLDPDYMLDNFELNNLAMTVAVAQLQRNLTQETDIVNQIVTAVGDSVVQTALQNITETLSERVTTLEEKVHILESYVRDIFNPTKKTTEFELSKVPTAEFVDCYINGIKYQEETYFTVDREKKGDDGNKGFKPTFTWLFTESNKGFDLDEKFEIVLEYLADDKKEMYVAPEPETNTETPSGGEV